MIDLGKSLIQIAVADVLFQQHNEEWQMKQNYKPSQKHKVRIISTIFILVALLFNDFSFI